MIEHTFVIAEGHTVTYKLGKTPFRLYHRYELPQSYQLEDWEKDEDTWIRKDKMFFNLREFITIGYPHLPGPNGGAQIAGGDFLIAGYNGKIYPVTLREEK